MSKRRHLGTIYESYPAKRFESWLVTVIFKIIMMIVTSIIWLGIFWVFCGIVNFLRVNLLTLPDLNIETMYRSTFGQGTYWGGVGMICVYIIFSKIGSRKKDQNSHRGERAKGIYDAQHE